MQAIYERRFGEVKEQFQQQRDLIEDNLKTMVNSPVCLLILPLSTH